MTIKDDRPLSERFPVGTPWRIKSEGSMWHGKVGVVSSTLRNADYRIPLEVEGLIDTKSEVLHFWPEDLTAAEPPVPGRVQDAPNEEQTIKALQDQLARTQAELKKSTELLVTATEALNKSTEYSKYLDGLTQAMAYPFRVQQGTHGKVIVNYYLDQNQAEQRMRTTSGFRTLEKRKGREGWTLLLRKFV